MLRSSSKTFAAATMVLAVAACGVTPKERALSGGAMGAGVGTVVGAISGLSLFEGALIGTGIGAVVGAVTNSDQINLGSLGSASPRAARQQAAAHSASPLVSDVQSSLTRAGYQPGPSDGISGRRTQNAILAYQRDNGLPADGRASAGLLEHIRNKQG